MQEYRISTFFGKERGNLVYTDTNRIVEDQSVKHAVDDVPDRPSHDQGDTDNQAGTAVLLYNLVKPPSDDDHGNDAEQAEKQLPETSSQFHPESHSFIFCKVDVKPIPENTMALPEIHGCFHKKLQCLITE